MSTTARFLWCITNEPTPLMRSVRPKYLTCFQELRRREMSQGIQQNEKLPYFQSIIFIRSPINQRSADSAKIASARNRADIRNMRRCCCSSTNLPLQLLLAAPLGVWPWSMPDRSSPPEASQTSTPFPLCWTSLGRAGGTRSVWWNHPVQRRDLQWEQSKVYQPKSPIPSQH